MNLQATSKKIISCRACGRDVSKKAKSCPHCGEPRPAEKLTGRATAFIILGIFVIVVLLSNLGSDNPTENSAHPAIGENATASTSPPSPRVFTEKDFDWNPDSDPYNDNTYGELRNKDKPVVIAGMNKIVIENKNCVSLHPEESGRDPTKGSKTNPVFFVQCDDPQGKIFVVFFSKHEVESGKTFTALKTIDQSKALDDCEAYVKSKSEHPQLVDFSRVMDVAFDPGSDGKATLRSAFTLPMSDSVKLKYNVECAFEGDDFKSGHIWEAQKQ